MIRQVEKTMLTHGMLPMRSVLVGLSGGADSAALLHILKMLSEKYGFTVYAAHVNHGLRGEAADADEQFSKELAKQLDIEFYSLRADVKGEAKRLKMSEELTGRRMRYVFFERLMTEHSIDYTATAHHKNDNSETILMNFMRGSGLRGLCGIPYKRDRIIRPLLDVSRQEIEAYCEKNAVRYVIDVTNLETVYTRNKVRHILIPEITEQFNPAFADTITKNAAVLAVEEDFIESETCEVYDKIVHDNAVDTERLCSLHKAVALRIIRKITARTCGNEDIPASVTEAVLELAKKNRTGSRYDIARGVYARIEYGKLIISETRPQCGEFCYEIVPGEKTYIPESGYYVLAEYCDEYKKDGSEYFSVPKGCKITVRNRRSGDKFAPWGMKGTKKLKDFMIDSKIPKDARSRIGILTIDDEIAWVIGCRRSRDFKFNGTGIKISILY